MKAEKSLGWIESNTTQFSSEEKEMLNQENQRLADKLKRFSVKMEEMKKRETDWNERESKYQATCKNFKKTIAELKKEVDSSKNSAKNSKSFETMFADHNKLKKTHEDTIKLLYSMVDDLTIENTVLREDRSRNRNFAVDTIESTMRLFDDLEDTAITA